MPITGENERPNWNRRVIPIVLVSAILIVFGRTCTFDFTLWDDPQTVSRNPLLNPPSPANTVVLWKKPIENLYIPVTYTVWSAAAWVGWLDVPDAHGVHLNPSVFHCLNVAIHVLSSLVVLALLRRILADDWAALVGAALFSLHPVQVEALAWVSGTKDLLYGLLSLLVAVTFLHFLGSAQNRVRWGWYALGTLLLAAAILAKPTGVVAPVLAVGIAGLEPRNWRRADGTAVGFWLLVAVAGGVVARLVQTGENAGPPAPLWFRPFIALDALSFYAGRLLWPFHLAIDYGRSPQYLAGSGVWRFTSLIPLAFLVLLLWRRVGRRTWVGLFLSVLPLLPVLGILTFAFQFYSTVADHYLYLAMFGVSLLAGTAFTGLTRKASGESSVALKTVSAVTIAGLVGMSLISFATQSHWQTSRTLFEHTIDVNPRSFISHYDLAELDQSENQPAAAVKHLRNAIAIRPDYVPAHAELGSLLLRLGRVDEGLEEWVKSLELTQEQEPQANLAPAYVNVIRAAVQFNRPQRAVELLSRAVERYPNDHSVLDLRGRLTPATRPR